MTQWEDVPAHDRDDPTPTPVRHEGPTAYGHAADEDSPFGGVARVDGLVYSSEDISPELQWADQRQPPPPVLPVREQPQPMPGRHVEPWKPGPDPVSASPATENRLLATLRAMIVPVVIMAGLGILVYRLIQAYGF